MKYESSNSYGIQAMTNVKVFGQATDKDGYADTRAMTLAPRHTCTSLLAKNGVKKNTFMDPFILIHVVHSRGVCIGEE